MGENDKCSDDEEDERFCLIFDVKSLFNVCFSHRRRYTVPPNSDEGLLLKWLSCH